ncbi:MAG: hypothetical protein ACRD0K_26080 [Egibacteraceae bacterium]
MAEVGAVYDITPVVRAPADIIGSGQPRQTEPTPGPKARDKWLTASVDKTTAEVIAAVFDEACRPDQAHRRPWVALVDGNAHQISRIQAEAAQRDVKVNIIVDSRPRAGIPVESGLELFRRRRHRRRGMGRHSRPAPP